MLVKLSWRVLLFGERRSLFMIGDGGLINKLQKLLSVERFAFEEADPDFQGNDRLGNKVLQFHLLRVPIL